MIKQGMIASVGQVRKKQLRKNEFSSLVDMSNNFDGRRTVDGEN